MKHTFLQLILSGLLAAAALPAFAISGGAKVANKSSDIAGRATVFLRLKLDFDYTEQFPDGYSMKEKGTKPGFCSGVLIERDIVLTAAHCVLGRYGNPRLSGRTRVSGTVLFPSVRNLKIGIKKVIPHARFAVEMNEREGVIEATTWSDLAVIRLVKPAPAAVPTIALPPMKIAEHHDGKTLTVRAYGFGATRSKNTKDAGISRAVELEGIVDLEKARIRYDQRAGKGICNGDSGGPTVAADVDGKSVLFGIHTLLDGTATSSPDLCRGNGYSVLVSEHIDWIRAAIKRVRKAL